MSYDSTNVMAFIVALISFFGTVIVVVLNISGRTEQERFKADTDKELAKLNQDLQLERDKRHERWKEEKVISKFRDPLLHATYDLQSRIYNILKQSFLPVFYTNGSDQEKEYAIENTVFLLAQFLGWTELIRQEIQFVDLNNDDETRKLRSLQDNIYSLFQTDLYHKGFRLFAGEQRAIGELMIDRTREIPLCIGYAKFINTPDSNINHWLDPLRESVAEMALDLKPFEPRLISIQHGLVELLEFLDPGYVYFPEKSRSRIDS